MTHFQLKEANRFYWMVKGHLIPESWNENDIMKTYNSYMTRLWGNNERAEYSTLGFEAAWKEREAKNFLTNASNGVINITVTLKPINDELDSGAVPDGSTKRKLL